MKKAGLVILVIGFFITIFTGFRVITREKVIDVGEIQITQDKNRSIAWSPLVGVATMVVGTGFIFFGKRKRLLTPP